MSEIGLATEQWNFVLSQALALVETPVAVLLVLVLHKEVVSVRHKIGSLGLMREAFL